VRSKAKRLSSAKKAQIVLGYCTFPSLKIANSICNDLVNDGTIACANVFRPHTALYKWEGEVQQSREVAVIMKLTAKNKKALKEKIRAKHPYKVPALTFWSAQAGHKLFSQWVYEQCI
jgi:periplasmic divalent cation tolerance protein